jgi:hypothetical protein
MEGPRGHSGWRSFPQPGGRHGGTGETMPAEAAWKTVADADMVLIVGADPHGSHPLLLSLLRQAHIERGFPLPPSAKRSGRSVQHRLPAGGGKGYGADPESPWRLWQPPRTKPPGPGMVSTISNRKALADIARAFAGAKSPLILVGGQLTGAKSGKGLGELSKLARPERDPDGRKAPLSPSWGPAPTAWRPGDWGCRIRRPRRSRPATAGAAW